MVRPCLGNCALCGAEIQKLMKCGSVHGADCYWVKAVQKYGATVALLQAGPPVSIEHAEWLRHTHNTVSNHPPADDQLPHEPPP